ncbi:LuxR C-terminal-related transcriptional regulator [Spirillospora sp. CA-294931]|uniref:helix-turn-helix transcriptional regulator n=1 Tax=Spirillospora sp. CA-294931 TaxID=3240042 RepID=UPI003D8CCEAB
MSTSVHEAALTSPNTVHSGHPGGQDPVHERRRAIAELVASATRDILAFVPCGFDLDGFTDRPPVETRLVVQHGAPLPEGFAAPPPGQAARIHLDVPMGMVIVDRRVAALAVEPSLADWSLVCQPATALSSLVAIFERFWRDAAVPGEAGDHGLAAVHLRVLRLLESGMTDREISGGLGISIRTVQRHVTTIMNALGVRSRLELGFTWRAIDRRPPHSCAVACPSDRMGMPARAVRPADRLRGRPGITAVASPA